MEFFRSLLRAMGLYDPTKVDIITELPLEVSQLILRKLDPESLMCAVQVSKKWLEVCRSDRLLRQSVRRYKRAEKKRMEDEFQVSPVRTRTEIRKAATRIVVPRRIYAPTRINAATVFGQSRSSHILRSVSRENQPSNIRRARSLRV